MICISNQRIFFKDSKHSIYKLDGMTNSDNQKDISINSIRCFIPPKYLSINKHVVSALLKQ